MATISHRNYRPPTRRAGGPRSLALPRSPLPVPPQKHASQRAKVKREGLVHLPPRGEGRERVASPPSRFRHRFRSTDIRGDATPSPDSTPRRESKRDGPVSTRGERKRGGRGSGRGREREGERRIVSRDRLLRGTTVSDSSIESVGLVALSASPPPLSRATLRMIARM